MVVIAPLLIVPVVMLPMLPVTSKFATVSVFEVPFHVRLELVSTTVSEVVP